MSDGPLANVVRHIRRVAGQPRAGNTEDAQLLERFLTFRDEAAFEALLRRHGPMVLAVCRRLLRLDQDVEDAFQATFLVLLRKAGSLRRRELLAPWLYGVAHRTALKARAQAARRQLREKPMADLPQPEISENGMFADLRSLLDAEIARLPKKLRLPVILCYLQGQTYAEAACQLGWPAGTVSGRLAQARNILRKRLTSRGLALGAGALDIGLTEHAQAAVSPTLIRATVKTATFLAAGGTIPPAVATLTEGALQAMFLNKLRVLTVVLAVAVCGTSSGVLFYPKAVGQPTGEQALEPKKVERPTSGPKTADKLRALLKARVEAAKAELDGRTRVVQTGRAAPDSLFGASKRLLEAQLDIASKKSERLAAYDAHLKVAKAIEETEKLFNDGRVTAPDVALSTYHRLEAEIWLEREKAKEP
jgi:RNA polymerase sigma factor (sigma-70 family)